MTTRPYAASVWQEDDLFVAQCLEIDLASQGKTQEEALSNLREALELFFETAPEEEQRRRFRNHLTVTEVVPAVG